MRRQPREYADDDGRVIVNMDVEGMRWYDRRIRKGKRAERRKASSTGVQLTKSEARRFTFHAVLAGLTIFAVYAVVWGLILLFMTQVWFR